MGPHGQKARLLDAHCHLAWATDAPAVARELKRAGVMAACCTVTPSEYLAVREAPSRCDNVLLGVGLHPWWVADGRVDEKDVEQACELVPEAALVGEVGLDFGDAHSSSSGNELQVRALERICAAAAADSALRPHVLSVHAVRSAGAALDVLGRSGALRSCRCVMHWFSGTSDDLGRAVHAGCWFSVGERMLSTRRGREYARQLPQGRLLLETDLPCAPGQAPCAQGLLASLGRAEAALAQVRGMEPEKLREVLAANARTLLDGVCALEV